jgi:hypothetical protein
MSTDQIKPEQCVHDWPEVRSLQVMITHATEGGGNFSVVLLGGPDGFRRVVEIDGTEPGARAKAISLGEIVHDTLESADLARAPDEMPDASGQTDG